MPKVRYQRHNFKKHKKYVQPERKNVYSRSACPVNLFRINDYGCAKYRSLVFSILVYVRDHVSTYAFVYISYLCMWVVRTDPGYFGLWVGFAHHSTMVTCFITRVWNLVPSIDRKSKMSERLVYTCIYLYILSVLPPLQKNETFLESIYFDLILKTSLNGTTAGATHYLFCHRFVKMKPCGPSFWPRIWSLISRTTAGAEYCPFCCRYKKLIIDWPSFLEQLKPCISGYMAAASTFLLWGRFVKSWSHAIAYS